MKKIIHIDMDAFFASVEQRDFPELRGKPIAVGGSAERGVVAAASYEARKYGVRSAMSSFKAKQLCPDLIFVKHRFDVYRSVSKQVMEIFKSITDLVEPLSLDEAYLDVTENKLGQKSATLLANEVRKRIYETTNLTASAGISFNKFLAKVASDINKPNGYAVIKPEEFQAFLDALPIEKFFGIGKKTAEKLKAKNIYKGIDIRNLSLFDLERNFGKLGVHLYNIVRGDDTREVKPNRIRKSIGCETTLSENIVNTVDLLALADKLSQELGERLGSKKAEGKTLTLKMKFEDFEQITRSISKSTYIKKSSEIYSIAKELIVHELPLKKPIRLMGLQLSTLKMPALEQKFGRQLRLKYPDFT